LGQKEEALAILQSALARRDGALAPNLLVHPSFDNLRNHAEFIELAAKVGFR
jgi:hypothetical protein